MPPGSSDALRWQVHSAHRKTMRRVIAMLLMLAAVQFGAWVIPVTPGTKGVAHYLTLHALMEVISISVAMMVFAVGWNSRTGKAPGNMVLLACMFFAIACLDFSHTLAYGGMPDYFTPNNPDKHLNFWIVARLLAASALLLAAVRPWEQELPKRHQYALFAALLTGVVVFHWVVIYHQEVLPDLFIPGQGLTPLKKNLEYLCIAINLATMLLLWTRMRAAQTFNAPLLFAAAGVMAMSEFYFTLYTTMTGAYNVLGHVYKVISYLLIYRAVVVESIERPYIQLEQAQTQLRHAADESAQANIHLTNTLDALPARIAYWDENLTIRFANKAYTDHFGYTSEQIQGRHQSEILGEEVFLKNLPFSQAALRGEEQDFERAIAAPDGKSVQHIKVKYQPDVFNAKVKGFYAFVYDVTDLKQTLNQLSSMAADLQKLALVAQHTANAVVMTDAQLRITWVNEGFTRVCGYTLEDALGKAPGELLGSGKADPATIETLRRATEQGVGCRVEILNRAKDGREYWLDTEVQPIRDASGQVVGFIEIGLDVTQELQTKSRLQQALLESEAQQLELDVLARVVRETSNAVVLTDVRGLIKWVNAGFTRITGYTLQEVQGRKPGDFLQCPETDPDTVATLRKAIAAVQPCAVEILNRSKEGRHYWLMIEIQPLVDPQGQHTGFMAIESDVTQARASQAEIESQKTRLNNIIKGTNAGTWEWHVCTGQAVFNERWADMLGYTLQELQPLSVETWKRLTHPEDLPRSDATLQQHFCGELDHYEIEIRMRHKDGHWVWVSNKGQLASREEDGSPGWMYGTQLDITQRKETEISLRLSQARTKTLSELSAHWFWETDDQLRFNHFICRDAQKLEQLNALALGRTRWEMDVEPLETSWEEHKAALARREIFLDFEYRRVEPDGAVRYWSVSGSPWFSDSGEFMGYIGTGSDISERKNTQARIARSEALLDRTAKIAKVGAWRVDLRTGEVEWSAETCHIHEVPVGYRPTREQAFQFYAPESQPVITKLLNKGVHRGEPWDVELPFISAKGRRMWVRTIGEVEFENEQPVVLVGTFQDVSERKTAEIQAQQAQETMLAAIDSVDEAFVIYDDQDRMTYCNQKYRDLYASIADSIQYGETFETIVRKGAESGIYKDAIGRVDEFVKERVLAHQSGRHQVVIQLEDGRVMRILDRKLSNGYIVGFRIDITELTEAKTKAELLANSKSQFLANMSHEIRTPMNAILGLLNLLQSTELTSRQRDYASKTEGAAQSLLGLLNDILDFSKVEAGKMTLESEPFHIDKLMRNLSVVLSANVGKKGIEVLFDIDPALPPVLRGDALRLQQILTNLGGNAVKFTSEGQVVLSMRKQAQAEGSVTIEFAVQDTGIGIAPQHQQHIFSGFSQAEASTTRRFGGTGLGLAISKRFVELMGGDIHITSKEGVGSTFAFTLELPTVENFTDTATAAETGNRTGSARPDAVAPRVLVVDDNSIAAYLTWRMVQSWGAVANIAASGKEAIDMVDAQCASASTEFPYPLIYMDWKMPDMDGWEATRQIRDLARRSNLPQPIVIMITGHGRETLTQRTEEEQALINGFVVKPATASMLRDAWADAQSGNAGVRQLAKGRSSKRRLSGMRILVVEDNLINQQVAEELLSNEGAFVSLAANGQLGVDAVAAAAPQFDVVLMDVQMPVLDGYGATRAIRQELNLQALPIIAMTANAMASDRDACLAAGMNEHIGKPFDMEKLVSLLIRVSGFESATYSAVEETAPAGPALTETVPVVAGLDIQAALNRMSGLRSLYVRTAKDFVLIMETAVAEIQQCLHAGDRQQAMVRLHTLKGNAGTLGATDMAARAAALEKLCATDAGMAECRASVPQFGELVRETQQKMRAAIALLSPEPVAAKPAPAVNQQGGIVSEAARQAMQRIEALLKSSDLEVLQVFAQSRELLGAFPSESIEALDEALQKFDLGTASTICKQLMRKLNA